jgi:drug/metabolite transporter (DMT)-like permease
MNGPNPPAAAAPRAIGLVYLALLALANLMWAGQGTAVKFLEKPAGPSGAHLGPVAVTFLPFYVTTLLLVPILVWRRRRDPNRSRPTWNDWWKFAIAGVAGQVLAQLGMTWGISLSLASNGAILNLMIPVISAVLASLMLRERLTSLRVLCLAVGMAGVLMMSVGDLEASSFFDTTYLAGNLLILVGCCGSSFYNVYCKGLLARFGEVEILIFRYVTASLASLPLLVWVEPVDWEVFGWLPASGWLAFGFLAVFHYGASMLLFFYVLEHVSVTAASVSLYLVPVFGVLFAVTLVGEKLNVLAVAGAAVVLLATILVMRYDTASA